MLLGPNRIRMELERLTGFPHLPQLRRALLAALFFLLFAVIVVSDLLTATASLRVGQVSDRDIIAPRTISYIHTAKTRQLEAEVLAGVATVYDLDISVSSSAEEHAAAVFRAVRAAQVSKLPAAEKHLLIERSLSVVLPASAIGTLIDLSDAELKAAEEQSKTLLRRYLQRGVREDELDAVKRHVVPETERLGLKNPLKDAVVNVVQSLLKPNFIMNPHETEKRRQFALASIEPIRETIKKGQILVRKGDVADEEHIKAMEELGMYQADGNVRLWGVAGFLLIVMAAMAAYLRRFAPSIYENTTHLVLIGLVMVITLLLCRVTHYYSDFIAPVATGALLVAILFNIQVGVLVSIGLALLFGLIAGTEPRIVAVAVLGGMTGVYTVSKVTHGYSLTKTGLRLAAVNVLVIGALGWADQIAASQLLLQMGQGAMGGIASAIISIGVLPYLESGFHITTPLTLLELAKPNHPLMQRLLLEVPGTYHHSILVGNLAETAADCIGADAITVRVGAYYHDIGKTKRPAFFIENQGTQENPHDKISPSLSTLIVLSHVKDGCDLAREYNLPRVIRDIIQQHHGTTLVSYFYQRAMETEHGECVIESDFHYEGPRPQTKEAALVMLADSCEAAVRSLGRPNVNRIEATVRRIIKERLNDGQLDDCKLTLADLKTIGDVFIRVLSSMYHKRIEYPDTKDVERRKNKNGNTVK